MASRPMRNIETFPSQQMYLHLSLVERKVTEFYHDIDRRRWLVWLKWLIFITFFRTIDGVLARSSWSRMMNVTIFLINLDIAGGTLPTSHSSQQVLTRPQLCGLFLQSEHDLHDVEDDDEHHHHHHHHRRFCFKRQLMCSISLLLYLIFWQSTPKTFKVWLIFLEKCVNSNLDL